MFSLPQEIQQYIYEFDPTYREKFQICLLELKSKSIKEGDIVMLNENLLDNFYLPKTKCFTKYYVVRVYESIVNGSPWIELDSYQFYKIHELKKVIEDGPFEYYYSFLNQKYTHCHSRLLYDFQVGDNVMFDPDGFRYFNDHVRDYTHYSRFFGLSYCVLSNFGEYTVELERLGEIPRIYLKLCPTSSDYQQEFSYYLEQRKLASDLHQFV